MSTVVREAPKREEIKEIKVGQDAMRRKAASPPPSLEEPTDEPLERAPAVDGKKLAGKPKKSRWRVPAKRILLAALLIGGLAGGAAYGLDYWRWASVHESTDDAFIDGRILQVSPHVAGHVLKVYVNDNQDVKAGDVLVELDPQSYQAAVDQAKGRVDAAQADLLAARSQVEQANAQVAAAGAALAQSQADLAAQTARRDEAQANLAQYKKAQATGVVSALEMTKIETEVRTSSANVDASTKAVAAAEAQVSQAQATLKAQQSRVGVAAAQIETAKAALESAKLDLGYTKVVAAEDGRVTKKNVEAGNYVSPGTPILALVSPDVWVTANFKETQLAHMKPGQKVDIEVDSYPGVKFAGHVDSVQQGSGARFSLLPPENATGNYVKVVQRVPVKIEFDGPRDQQHLLGPGMSVEPSVRIEN